jgi:lipopolysaccharide transport system permease protein
MKINNAFLLIHMMAKMNLKAEASRLYLSYLWWILEPFLYVLVFYLVFKVILNNGREDFLFFLICGKIPFLWFSKSITASSRTIVSNTGLIGQTNFDKIIFPLVKILEFTYKELVVFLFLFIFISLSGYYFNEHWVWLPAIIFVQFMLILVCGCIAALLVVWIRDFEMLIPMLMLFLMFTSGIFWDINEISNQDISNLILWINPVAFLLDAYRAVLLNASSPNITHLAILGCLTFALGVTVSRLYRKLSKTIAMRVLSQ